MHEIKKDNARPEERRTINVFVLAMLSVAVVISLRNLPITAQYGLSSFFFYAMAALCFMIPYALIAAELASGWPKAGGVYIWVKEAFGERWGFFAIWMQWFHNVTWYPAMLAFVGAALAYLFDPTLAQHKGYLIAVILIGFWGITFLNFFGIKTSAWVSTSCVLFGTLLPGILLIAFGFFWVLTDHPIHLTLSTENLLPSLSSLSQLVFLAGIFLALAGLEANANLAREVKNPQKNYPRAILIAALITLSILILGSFAIAIVIPKEEISLVASLLEAFHLFFKTFHMEWLGPPIALLTALGALGELNAWAIAAAKGLYATTEHGLLPPFFHKMNRRFVPTRLLIFQAVIVTIASFIFLYLPNVNISYWVLSALSAQMYLLVYLLLFVAGLTLRYTKPDIHRPYRIPFKNHGIWIATVVGILSSLFTFVVSFVPPAGYETGNLVAYELLLIGAIVISVIIPLWIFACKKPSWQKEVLTEIRDEIHMSLHPGADDASSRR